MARMSKISFFTCIILSTFPGQVNAIPFDEADVKSPQTTSTPRQESTNTFFCSPPIFPCSPDLTCCGLYCVNTQTDPSNCGSCSNACSGSTPYCVAGICSGSSTITVTVTVTNGPLSAAPAIATTTGA